MIFQNVDKSWQAKVSTPNKKFRRAAKTKLIREAFRNKQGRKLRSTKWLSFNLPAGKSCPGAGACASWCYAKTGAYRWDSVSQFRLNNFYSLVKINDWDNLVAVLEGITRGADIMRLHDSGDFFNYRYFTAWVEVARRLPETIIYGYTKSVNYVSRYLDNGGTFPDNFKINLSYGSRFDDMIEPLAKKYDFLGVCHVLSMDEIKAGVGSQLPYNGDEFEAIFGSGDFKIGLHLENMSQDEREFWHDETVKSGRNYC